MITLTLRATLLATATSLLVACLGSGGSGTSGDSPPVTPPPGANRAPTISVVSTLEVLVGRGLTITPSASDPDGDSLLFSVSNRPAWMSFSAQTGVLAGTPGAGDVGVYNPVITVSDGKAQGSDQASVMVVQAAAGRATLSWQAPAQRTDGSPLTICDTSFRLPIPVRALV